LRRGPTRSIGDSRGSSTGTWMSQDAKEVCVGALGPLVCRC
jgi:hypothetical protein